MNTRQKNLQQLCKQQRLRLTTSRQQVLDIIYASERPLGAYDVLSIMQQRASTAPPTVYRALAYLCTMGLVHKLESMHAYVACICPGTSHSAQFLICSECGLVTELDNNRVAAVLDSLVAEKGFSAQHEMVEIAGQCADCMVISQ